MTNPTPHSPPTNPQSSSPTPHSPPTNPQIAIVHDWLTNRGGAERVVKSLLELYPAADLYTSVYNKQALDLFADKDVKTTWLQKIPGSIKYKHQLWAPLRPLAFRSLRLKKYDLIISSSSAESKQVRAGKNATHICYCYTPIRYYWVKPEYYRKNPGLGPLNFMAPLVMPIFLKALKRSDYKAAQKVDGFITISRATKDRIDRYYQRQSVIVAPPVETGRFKAKAKRAKYFVTAGRQVAYKRHDLAVAACKNLNLPLLVLGNGPENSYLKEIAGPTIKFIDNPSDQDIEQAFNEALAFIHPGEEDFGITPVEAMAGGCPVIAFAGGGALDYVEPDVSGVLFNIQTTASLVSAISEFNAKKFDTNKIVAQAQKFSAQEFKQRFAKQVEAIRRSPT